MHHAIELVGFILYMAVFIIGSVILLWLAACMLWWMVTDIFWDNFKIVNGRLRRRRVRYWQFGGF